MGKFQVFQDKKGEYRFRLKSSNGQVVLKSQGYTSKQSAMKGIKSVARLSENSKKFVRKNAKNGQFYFTLKSVNGQVVGTSGEYASKGGLELGIKSVMKNAPKAKIDK